MYIMVQMMLELLILMELASDFTSILKKNGIEKLRYRFLSISEDCFCASEIVDKFLIGTQMTNVYITNDIDS